LTEAEARGADDADLAVALASAREQQAAVADILRVISRAPKDLQAVFDVIATSARRFCSAEDAMVGLVEGDRLVGRAHDGAVGWVVGSALLDRQLPATGCIVDGRAIHVRDMQTDTSEDFRNAREIAMKYGIRTVLATPMLHGGKAIGSITLRRTEVRPFTDAQIELVRTFADQAAIAIENVRLFNETKDALDQQTATADVLKTISRSAFDLQAVFDVVVENATKLCRGEWGYLFRKEGEVFRLIATHGGTPALIDHERAHPTVISDRTLIGRVALRRSVVHIPDLFEDPDYDWPANREHGVHTVLAVPIFRDDEVVGAIGAARNERRPFSDADIRLLQTFADQATIAIENVRLFNETKESLERQTALAEILGVIADSPADQQPVVDAIARSTTRYCGAEDAAVFLLEGDMLRRVAHHGRLPVVSSPILPLERGAVAGRAILERRTVHVADVAGAEGDDFLVTRARAAVTGQRGTLATPMLREGSPIGVILLRKMEPTGYTPSQIQLVEAFADQAVIAIENVRLFNETKEALERQTATSSILNVISRSPADQQPTLDAIVESGARLCDADMAFIYVVEQSFFKLRAGYKVPPAFVEYTNADPVPVTPHRGSLSGRVVAERRAVQIPDVLVDAEYTYLEGQRLVGYRSMLNVPMFSKGELIGIIGLWRTAPVAFTAKQIDLMNTFADQAVIAIENTRLFNETKEALERQTSISDVLQTIGRSAFDLQPVLDTVVERAVKLCDAREGSISTLEDDVYRTRAYWSVSSLPPAYINFMRHEVRMPERGSLIGRTALEGRVVHIADVLEDPEYTATDMQQAAGCRTLLGVPLLRDGRVIGVFALTRNEVRPFSDRQIELVRTFADQAAIAIENTRLFVATKEALEQQTAISEVLKTISRSAFDLQPVLDIVLNNAVRLAGADIGWLSRVENEQFMTVAYSAEFPESVKEELVRQRAQGHLAGPWVPLGTGGGLMGFTLAEGRTVHLPDVKVDPELKGSVIARLTAARTVVGVPMLRDGLSIGGMVLARYDVRPYGERELELVQTFADQAAIAIENVRLFDETKEALEQQSAISEVLKTISGTVFDLQPTLQTVVENAAKLADADVAWMMQSVDNRSYTWGARYGRTPELEALFGEPPHGRIIEIDRVRPSIMGRVYTESRTIVVHDVEADPELLEASPVMRLTKSRSLIGVPVMSEGIVAGAIVLGRLAVRPFAEREVQLVETFADQAAIAIRNVRLFNEIQDKSQQLEVASRHKSEFLANMSHELRTPLNAIIGFSEVLAEGLFGEVNEKQRDYLQDVIGSGQHLLSLINDILDLAKIEAGRMELELSTFSFRSALQSGITIVRERAARNGITLNVDVSDELDRVEADERKVKQILYNLLSNAVKFTPDGGNVNVTVRRDNGGVRVDVRDNGIGIAEADQARIFEEFQQVGRERSREGTGLGLTLTKRFVELHGGRIWLESAPGQGSTFTFTLPLRQAAPVRA
jgi:GAF domain-containing protein